MVVHRLHRHQFFLQMSLLLSWAGVVPAFQTSHSRVCSNRGAGTSATSGDSYEFSYVGSDGRLKATFEGAFRSKSNQVSNTKGRNLAPWEFGYQMSEKNLAWNDGLKSRLLARVAADKLHITDEDMELRLQQLRALLPDITNKLSGMRPAIIVGLLQDINELPSRLMGLKAVFPGANVSKMAVREPALVLGFDIQHLEEVAKNLQEMLPGLDVDRLVEENPSMLDIEERRAAMAEAKRIMPSLDIVKAMGTDPGVILSFQRGSQLIPYDPPSPEIMTNEQANDDDEYSAYYKG